MNEEIINTEELKKFSLTQVMKRIGYTLMRSPNNHLLFVNPDKFRNGKGTISVKTAIELHNNTRRLEEFMDIDPYTLRQFKAAKIVRIVKLQYSSRKKIFVLHPITTNYVEFVDSGYPSLFFNIWKEVTSSAE